MAEKSKINEPFIKLTVSGYCCDKIVKNGQVFYWRAGDPIPPVCIEMAPQLCLYLYHFEQGGLMIDDEKTFKLECPDKRTGKPCVSIVGEIIEMK